MNIKAVSVVDKHKDPESMQAAESAVSGGDTAITKMKSHLDEISKLMETIQMNTNSIDDEVARCEKIICSTFDGSSEALERRKESLLHDLHKTAKVTRSMSSLSLCPLPTLDLHSEQEALAAAPTSNPPVPILVRE